MIIELLVTIDLDLFLYHQNLDQFPVSSIYQGIWESAIEPEHESDSTPPAEGEVAFNEDALRGEKFTSEK